MNYLGGTGEIFQPFNTAARPEAASQRSVAGWQLLHARRSRPIFAAHRSFVTVVTAS
jgi:hypothetical protein